MRQSMLVLALTVMVGGLLAPMSAHADGSEVLGQSLHEFVIGGGVVSEGVGLSGRTMSPPRRGQPGEITISTVPAGASVVKALLYWVVLGGPDWTATFQGQQIEGQEIGVSVDSWSCGYQNYARNIAYRTDVTSLVPGNGTYSIAGVGNERSGDDAQGASLVIVYEDDTAPTVTEIVIHDGAITGGNIGDGIPTGGFEDNYVQFGGLSGAAAALSAKLHVGFGDGQGTPSDLNPGAGPLKIAGTTLAPPGFLTGSDGPLWDDQTFAVPTAVLPAGRTAVTVEINSGDDCIVWNYAALEIELPDQFGPIIRGIPDRPASPAGWFDGPVTIRWEAKDPNGATPVSDTVASSEGKNITYTSGQSCDGLGNCATGSITLSIDETAPNTTLRPFEFPLLDQLPIEQDSVRIFDQWVSGTATDALSGIDTVRVEATDLSTGETASIPLEYLYCDWQNPDRTSCEYGARLPDGSEGAFRVIVTAIDRAGGPDRSPIDVIMIQPPSGLLPDECPLGPLCG